MSAGYNRALAPESGGKSEAITALDRISGEVVHSFPQFIPGQRRFVYLVSGERPGVYATSIGTEERTTLLDRAPSFVQPVSSGHLLLVEQQNLIAQPVDFQTLTLKGSSHVIASGVPSWAFSASTDVILFADLPDPNRRLTWLDRRGQRGTTIGDAGPYRQIVLAPSPGRAVLERQDGNPPNVDLWLLETSSGVLSRLTRDAAQDVDAAWAPDERRFVFSSRRLGKSSLFVKDLTSGAEQPVLQSTDNIVADDWSPDGRFVIYRTVGRAMFALPMTGDRTPKLLADTPFVEDQSQVSPRGDWIAFNSNESGRWEVYVAAFPDFTRKRQVASGGGVQPLWRRDGRELFFLGVDGRMMAVDPCAVRGRDT